MATVMPKLLMVEPKKSTKSDMDNCHTVCLCFMLIRLKIM